VQENGQEQKSESGQNIRVRESAVNSVSDVVYIHAGAGKELKECHGQRNYRGGDQALNKINPEFSPYLL